MDSFSLIVVSFVLDNFYPRTLDIREIVKGETFKYPTNQYGLTKINGAVFKRDGLIFKGRGYYYNLFTDKETLLMCDSMAGFARLIQDETKGCDILYRLDERLSMPEQDYFDYASDSFARFYGPRFNFDGTNLDTKKTIIVHIDESTQAKLLMVIKKCIDQNTNTDFWHIEIETLPYYEKRTYPVITTFLHGMYYPINKIFTHIDYTKNQYSAGEYSQKYADSVDGMSIDHYTSCRDLHYKIWCIENGQFSRETWYKLMMVSLPKIYQNLLGRIAGREEPLYVRLIQEKLLTLIGLLLGEQGMQVVLRQRAALAHLFKTAGLHQRGRGLAKLHLCLQPPLMLGRHVGDFYRGVERHAGFVDHLQNGGDEMR